MTPFVVRIALGSPVSLGRRLTLDGILAGLILGETDDAARAENGLPLARTDGVWHGSAAIAEAPARWAMDRTDFARPNAVRAVRIGDMEPGTIGPNARGRYDRIDPKTGAYRNLMSPIGILATPALWFAGAGDPRAVRALLERAQGVGKRANSGWGEIRGVDVEEGGLSPERAGVVDADGFPLRPVPVDAWPRFAGCEASLCIRASETTTAPYWRTDRIVPCVVPAELTRVQMPDAILARFGLEP